MNDIERWRSVKNFPDYEISNLLRVRSYKGRNKLGRLLKNRKPASGRIFVTLWIDGKGVSRQVEDLYLESFESKELDEIKTQIFKNKHNRFELIIRFGRMNQYIAQFQILEHAKSWEKYIKKLYKRGELDIRFVKEILKSYGSKYCDTQIEDKK